MKYFKPNFQMLGNPSKEKKKSNLSTPSQKLTKRQNNPTDKKKKWNQELLMQTRDFGEIIWSFHIINFDSILRPN